MWSSLVSRPTAALFPLVTELTFEWAKTMSSRAEQEDKTTSVVGLASFPVPSAQPGTRLEWDISGKRKVARPTFHLAA